jgi:hypothetical protein
MISDLTSFYLELGDRVRMPKSLFESSVKQIKGGLLDPAFGSKGRRLEDEAYLSKFINLNVIQLILLLELKNGLTRSGVKVPEKATTTTPQNAKKIQPPTATAMEEEEELQEEEEEGEEEELQEEGDEVQQEQATTYKEPRKEADRDTQEAIPPVADGKDFVPSSKTKKDKKKKKKEEKKGRPAKVTPIELAEGKFHYLSFLFSDIQF